MKALYTYTLAIAILLFNFNINATNQETPEGIVYQLTVKSTDIAKSKQVIEEFHFLRKIMAKGSFYYQFGKYNHYKIADSVKIELEKITPSAKVEQKLEKGNSIFSKERLVKFFLSKAACSPSVVSISFS